jgi:hypothetical protein
MLAFRPRASRCRGITLVEIVTLVVVAIALVAILLPSFRAGSRQSKVALCADHLSKLHQASQGKPDQTLGRARWVRLAPSAVGEDALRCPLAEHPAFPDTDYLGPSRPPSELKPDDAVGCDALRNHSRDGKQGGNILTRSGRVIVDHTGLWASSVQSACRP